MPDVIFFLCQHRVRPSHNPKTPPNVRPPNLSNPTHDPCTKARNGPKFVSHGPEIVWNPCHGECRSVRAEWLWRPLSVVDRSSTSGSLPRFLLHDAKSGRFAREESLNTMRLSSLILRRCSRISRFAASCAPLSTELSFLTCFRTNINSVSCARKLTAAEMSCRVWCNHASSMRRLESSLEVQSFVRGFFHAAELLMHQEPIFDLLFMNTRECKIIELPGLLLEAFALLFRFLRELISSSPHGVIYVRTGDARGLPFIIVKKRDNSPAVDFIPR